MKQINTSQSILRLINNKYLIIENYIEISDITLNMIVTKYYRIEGDDLIVKKMDGYFIEIKGQIKKIISL